MVRRYNKVLIDIITSDNERMFVQDSKTQEWGVVTGGCKGTFQNDLPTELTHRQMFASNINFITTLQEIEYEGGSLLKNIEPINNVQFYWANEQKFMNFNRKCSFR